MFTQSDGPTALRMDLVHALAFSLRDTLIDSPAGPRMARCAIAGVWNDSKGAVVVVVRHLDPPLAVRYAFSDPVNTPDELDQAVDAALGFAESLGFIVDDPEYRGLDEAERTKRMRTWNQLRKVRAPKGVQPTESAPKTEPLELKPTEPPPGEGDRAVLGRISLVQREEGERYRTPPRARLRSFF